MRQRVRPDRRDRHLQPDLRVRRLRRRRTDARADRRHHRHAHPAGHPGARHPRHVPLRMPMRTVILVIAIAITIPVAACIDPPGPPPSPVDPSATSDQPIIGGSAVTGPTRAVIINIPPKGLCTGILLNEDTVLTAFHCVEKGVPAGTTVSHPLGAATETANVKSPAHLDPLLAFITPSPGPDWDHDIAVLDLDHSLTIPAGARDALLDDGSTTPTGSVECIGAGANYPGAPGGTLTTLTFPIVAGSTASYVTLEGHL